MKLIVGLGNPEVQYENTRHNIGFKAIDLMCKKYQVELNKSKHMGNYYKSDSFILAKPLTYMNRSGEFVARIAKFYKIKLEDILIIYDDMDLPVGKAVMRPKGSSGGQNGMKDIIEQLGTEEIARLKIGIGRPNNNSVNHVLGTFSPIQIDKLNKLKPFIEEAISLFIDQGLTQAMNYLNSQKLID